MEGNEVKIEQMIIGREYIDNKLYSYWIAEKAIPDGMIMKNLISGIRFYATPKTCNLKFYNA